MSELKTFSPRAYDLLMRGEYVENDRRKMQPEKKPRLKNGHMWVKFLGGSLDGEIRQIPRDTSRYSWPWGPMKGGTFTTEVYVYLDGQEVKRGQPTLFECFE